MKTAAILIYVLVNALFLVPLMFHGILLALGGETFKKYFGSYQTWGIVFAVTTLLLILILAR